MKTLKRAYVPGEEKTMSIRTLLHPSVFQGKGKTHSYFEGWYFKMAIEGEVIALIPGVALGAKTEENHSFIQVISSRAGKSWYVRFPYEAFKADEKKLDITIGANHFTLDGISVDLAWEELSLKAEIHHLGTTAYPVSLAKPGIMGWYAFVPFMECFHAVVSTHHALEGDVLLNGRGTTYSGGVGYIEKDWGSSFPSAWIWMQSNLFPSDGVCCMLSVANIPFLGNTFTGFLGFLQLPGKLIRFGTYTNAKILTLEQDGTHARIVIRQKGYLLEFAASLGPASYLTAPRQGNMDRIIQESVMGTIVVTLKDRKGELLFQETGTLAGIELSEAGDLKL